MTISDSTGTDESQTTNTTFIPAKEARNSSLDNLRAGKNILFLNTNKNINEAIERGECYIKVKVDRMQRELFDTVYKELGYTVTGLEETVTIRW
jgi:hypothetical protein